MCLLDHAYLQQRTSRDTLWLAPDSGKLGSAGGEAIPAVEEPWHGWDPSPALVDKQPLHCHTTETVISTNVGKHTGCCITRPAYIFLLFMHMADLEPDVLFSEGCWW
jgi:hypothetical protein